MLSMPPDSYRRASPCVRRGEIMLRQLRLIKSGHDLLSILDSLFQRKSTVVSALVVHTLVVGSLWLLLVVNIARSTHGPSLW